MTWSLDLCRGWHRIGIVDDYEFAGTLRDLAVGEWHLSCSAAAPAFGAGYGPGDVDTMRLVLDGELVFGGYVAPVNGEGGHVRTDNEDGTGLAWSGPDIWDILARRLAFPDPTREAPWTVSHDVRSGPAAAALAAFIEVNVGASALSGRSVSDVRVVNTGSGTAGEWSARLQPLSLLAQRICADGDITCRPSVSFAGELEIWLGSRRDLSAQYRVSDQGDISSIEARKIPTDATWVAAGGQGEGTERLFANATSGASGVARRERFLDRSSLATLDELTAAADAAIGEDVDWSVRYEPADGSAIAWGRDVLIGDLVGVQIGEDVAAVPVTSLVFDISADRQHVTPVLGDASWNELTGLLDAVDAITNDTAVTIA